MARASHAAATLDQGMSQDVSVRRMSSAASRPRAQTVAGYEREVRTSGLVATEHLTHFLGQQMSPSHPQLEHCFERIPTVNKEEHLSLLAYSSPLKHAHRLSTARIMKRARTRGVLTIGLDCDSAEVDGWTSRFSEWRILSCVVPE